MPLDIQDLPLEIQNMIIKHANARSIHEWAVLKLYKDDGIVTLIYPFVHLVRNKVVLSYRENRYWREKEEDVFMAPWSKDKPYVVACNKSPPPPTDDEYAYWYDNF